MWKTKHQLLTPDTTAAADCAPRIAVDASTDTALRLARFIQPLPSSMCVASFYVRLAPCAKELVATAKVPVPRQSAGTFNPLFPGCLKFHADRTLKPAFLSQTVYQLPVQAIWSSDHFLAIMVL
jgi:hypothetical protein